VPPKQTHEVHCGPWEAVNSAAEKATLVPGYAKKSDEAAVRVTTKLLAGGVIEKTRVARPGVRVQAEVRSDYRLKRSFEYGQSTVYGRVPTFHGAKTL